APGLPQIMTGDLLTNEDREQFRQNLGLDRPVWEQYFVWWGNLLRGDLGASWTERAPVLDVIFDRLPATLTLLATSLTLAVVVGIPIGILSAVKRYSLLDYVFSTIAMGGLAIPSFWMALLMILLFSVNLGWLPSAGMQTINEGFSIADRAQFLIMPTIVTA